MPLLSQRIQATPTSPIRRLVPYAEAAKKQGVKVYHLNIGQPDIQTPAAAVETMRNADYSVIEYSHSAGTASYRQKLAEFYKNYNIDIEAEDIIVTNGGSEALWFTMISCLDAGDEILVPEPFYANYNGFAQSLGIQVQPITAKIENNFALPPISDFEPRITTKTRAILICHPGNPTGYLYSRQELEQLGELVKKYSLFLIVDEVYRDFVYGDEPHVSVLTLKGLEQQTVVIDSISKRYSACGARIGLMMSKNKELISMAMRLAQARLSPSTIAQILAEALVDTPKSYFQEVLEAYRERRDLMVRRLRAMPGVVCPEPGGAFYILAKLPIDDADAFCRWLLEIFRHENQTLMLAPGSGFYAGEGLGRQEVRLAYVLNKEELEAAMDCLEQALRVYPGCTTTL